MAAVGYFAREGKVIDFCLNHKIIKNQKQVFEVDALIVLKSGYALVEAKRDIKKRRYKFNAKQSRVVH